MADRSPVVTGTPEEIALRLLELVAAAEDKSLGQPVRTRTNAADREWIMQTFQECLLAVRQPKYRS